MCKLRHYSMNCRHLFLGAVAVALLLPATGYAQLPALPGESPSAVELDVDSLPFGADEAFTFESDETLGLDKTEDQQKEEDREQAFDAALKGLLPLRPEEIRTLLERFDRTQESVETPVYPNPKPEVVVQNISLDPGALPPVIKLAYGHVTTVNFLDSTGSPWPVQDVSWAGNFEIIQTSQNASGADREEEGGGAARFAHMFRISPQSEFAFGNMSITMTGLKTPVIITLETNRDVVHYRFDAVLPDYGPLARAPLIEAGITTAAGSKDLSSILEGVLPASAVRLDVSGVDGRTSAYRYNNTVFVRTPLTLLSPGWSSSASSADGTRVYEIKDASVLLLSDRGRMVRAKLTDRLDTIEGMSDE